MVAFQVLLPFLRIRMGREEIINLQPVILTASQHPVDLVRGNEKAPLGIVVLGGGEKNRFTLKILKLPQQFRHMTAPKAHQVRIFCIGGGKYAPFLRDFLQHLRVSKQNSDALLDFRKAALFGKSQTKDGSITRFSGLRRHISGSQCQSVSQSVPFKGCDLTKLALGHIPPQIQQLPDAFCRLLPCDKGCIAVLRGIAVVLCQKRGVILQGMILHKISADNQAAVSVIRPNAKRFINDLLG